MPPRTAWRIVNGLLYLVASGWAAGLVRTALVTRQPPDWLALFALVGAACLCLWEIEEIEKDDNSEEEEEE